MSLHRLLPRALFLIWTISTPAKTYAQSPGPNPGQMDGVVSAARLAFNPGPDIHSVHLTGSAVMMEGRTTHTGSMDMTLSSTGESTLTLGLDSGQQVEQLDAMSPSRSCTRTGPKGDTAMSPSECWLAVNWVFPQLSLQSATRSSQVSMQGGSVKNIGGELSPTLSGATSPSGFSPGLQPLIQRWSAMTIALDATSQRIAQLTYFQTPDNGSQMPIAMTVRYSDYRTVNGITVPFRIERLINGNTNLVLTVSSVATN